MLMNVFVETVITRDKLFFCRLLFSTDFDHRACEGFPKLLVVAETHFDACLLEMVTDGDLLLDERHDLVFLEFQEGLLVHLQRFLKGVKLSGHILCQTVFLQFLLHPVEVGFRAGTVVEVLGLGEGYEISPVLVGEMEILVRVGV